MTPVYLAPPSLLHTHTPSHTHPHTHTATAGDYAEVRESNTSPVLGMAFSKQDVHLMDKIGEGQFGDVRKGVIYPDVCLFVRLPNYWSIASSHAVCWTHHVLDLSCVM